MKLDDIKKLHQKKYRQQFGHFIVEGEHVVLELQKAIQRYPALAQSQLYVTEAYQHWSSPFKTQLISEKQFRQIADTESPQGILAVVPLLPTHAETGDSEGMRCIYLHEIQDPGNLGTILRTLAWFGGFRVLLSPDSVDPYNPKVIRASMGAIFHVPIELDVPWSALTKRFTSVAILDLHGASIRSDKFKDYYCYAFGNEARGLPEALRADSRSERFTIEGAMQVESLNLAAAVNISAYELAR